MAARVLLHVGTPKTATTFFQDVLFSHREELSAQGIAYPGETFDAQFRASLDLIRREWGGLEDDVVGEWDALAAEVRASAGTVIISNEILGGATREQAARALASFGDAEVHVVLTARDPFRQIPAEWQETVKHFGTQDYAEFLTSIRSRTGRSAELFWAVQDLPAILDRWAADLPPERVHVVTLPPRGTDHEVLWRRLESVFGLTGLGIAPATDRANESLGANATAFVRHLNTLTPDILTVPEYRWLVMELLAHRTLATRENKRRIVVPPAEVGWVAETAGRWITDLAARGYDVVGDLAELAAAAPDPEDFRDPDVPDPVRIASIATAATVALLAESGRVMRERDALAARVDELEQVAGLRNATRARLQTSGVGRAGLRAYAALRGNSSRRA